MRKVILLTVCVFWFNHSYDRNIQLGYDFRIFHEAGKGNLVEGWAYSGPVQYFFAPLGALPYEVAYLVWYVILSLSWWGIVKRIHPLLFVASFYPALLALEASNITLLLAWACLSPLGSVLASLVKPYLFVFVLLHAYWIGVRNRGYTQKESSNFLTNNN